MLLRTGIVLTLLSASCSAQTTVTVSSTPSHPIPTALLFSDTSHFPDLELTATQSGDGGLYAELLQNRAFQKVTPGTTAALSAWTSIGSANLTVIADPTPVSDALPNALQVVIPTGLSTAVGAANTGYAGLNVSSGTTYHASFYYRFPASTSFSGEITVSLQSTSGSILASNSVTASGDTTSWTQASVELKPEGDGDGTSNVFAVTVDGEEAAGETIHFAMFSLFPPTYKDRPNGMRRDIAEALEGLGPSFFRFPGGNNLGETVAQRWQWNATLGDLVDRPGRLGDWRYINTDGLGIYEYLVWCEDIKAEPIMAVWAGYALQHETIAETDLGPYIQQAIDQIYFVIGDPETNEHAARRAALGHPDPFYLKYVEIGNEDFVAAAATTYPYRWKALVNALKDEFPDLHFIATTFPFDPILDPEPTEYDNHVYESTTWMAQNTFYYDDYERNGTQYFEVSFGSMEARAHTNNVLVANIILAAITDAAFMTGFERNADIVFAAAYAPVLMHIQNQRWHPNMINFNAGAMYLSPAYYTQQLFCLNRGTDYIPSTLPERNGTLFWTVVQNTAVTPTQLIIKVVNSAVDASADVTFVLPFENASSEGTVQVLTGPQFAMNNPTTPNAVLPPVKSTINTGSTFTYSAAALSLNVITLTI
ncbi:glycoside hydrolase family 51 protein [Hymenopellis radicata]|nr:glycoside hydrolase family 51 protein [Hymenopellis radicata]